MIALQCGEFYRNSVDVCICVCVCGVSIGHWIVRKILLGQFGLQYSVVQRILRKYFNSTQTVLFIVNHSTAKTQMPQLQVLSSKSPLIMGSFAGKYV